jgi:hypothetical protein
VLGPEPLGHNLATVLGPTFAPLPGSLGKAAAIWFIMLNMFHGTLHCPAPKGLCSSALQGPNPC